MFHREVAETVSNDVRDQEQLDDLDIKLENKIFGPRHSDDHLVWQSLYKVLEADHESSSMLTT